MNNEKMNLEKSSDFEIKPEVDMGPKTDEQNIADKIESYGGITEEKAKEMSESMSKGKEESKEKEEVKKNKVVKLYEGIKNFFGNEEPFKNDMNREIDLRVRQGVARRPTEEEMKSILSIAKENGFKGKVKYTTDTKVFKFFPNKDIKFEKSEGQYGLGSNK